LVKKVVVKLYVGDTRMDR